MQSRRGIERLGAKLDGILRSHQLAPDGTLRDTCVYSIIASEWPTVQSHLDLSADEAAGVTLSSRAMRRGIQRSMLLQTRIAAPR